MAGLPGPGPLVPEGAAHGDRALDRLAGYDRALLEEDRPFQVRWAHPGTGAAPPPAAHPVPDPDPAGNPGRGQGGAALQANSWP